jgi:proteasome assembly chaperone (PAC2) family protein
LGLGGAREILKILKKKLKLKVNITLLNKEIERFAQEVSKQSTRGRFIKRGKLIRPKSKKEDVSYIG